MTKLRAPLTFDAALSRVAGQLPGGWDEMAAAVDRSPSYLRACGDPDRREKLGIEDAIVLDLAFRASGGDGYPLRQAYDSQLEIAEADAFGDRFTLLHRVQGLIKEAGEAHAALVRLCEPDAGATEQREALRELSENYEVIKPLLALLAAEAPSGSASSSAAIGDHSARAPP